MTSFHCGDSVKGREQVSWWWMVRAYRCPSAQPGHSPRQPHKPLKLCLGNPTTSGGSSASSCYKQHNTPVRVDTNTWVPGLRSLNWHPGEAAPRALL